MAHRIAVLPGDGIGPETTAPTLQVLADLGDLIVAAYRDAKGRADALASKALGPLAGGMPGFGG